MGYKYFTGKGEFLRLAGSFVYMLFILHLQFSQSSAGPSIQKVENQLIVRAVSAAAGWRGSGVHAYLGVYLPISEDLNV